MPELTTQWPGEAEPTTLTCRDCNQLYQTTNPRHSRRCGKCAYLRRLHASRLNYRNRKAKRKAAHA